MSVIDDYSVSYRTLGGNDNIDLLTRFNTDDIIIDKCLKLIGSYASARDIVYIKPGDEVLGVRVIGIPPIPIGFDHEKFFGIQKERIHLDVISIYFSNLIQTIVHI